VTDEQIRLYAIARLVAPLEARIRTIAEPTSGGATIYTIVVERGEHTRWFAVHSTTLREVVSDSVIALELKRVLALPPALPAPQG
jgi:hypothetical protein